MGRRATGRRLPRRLAALTVAVFVGAAAPAYAGSVRDDNDAERFDIKRVTFVRLRPDGPATLQVRFFEGFRGPALDGWLNSERIKPDLVLLTFRSKWGYLAGKAYIRWIEYRHRLLACFFHPDDPDFAYPRLVVGHPERDLLRLKIPSGLLPYGRNRVLVEAYTYDEAPWVWSTTGRRH